MSLRFRLGRAVGSAAACALVCASSAAALVCAAGPATIDVIGASAATLLLDGKPVQPGAPLPARARLSVAGGPVYLKVGERVLQIDDHAVLSVRGNKVKVASGELSMINSAGMSITLNAGEGATFCDVPGAAPLNWTKPAEQIPSELLPSAPPPPIPNQNLQIVSPLAP